MGYLDNLLKEMAEIDASDLHIQAGEKPRFRVNGQIVESDHPVMSNEECEKCLFEVLTEEQLLHFKEHNDLDFAYGDHISQRFRCNYFRHQSGIGGAFRRLSARIPTIEELGLPKSVEKVAHYRSGLVLVTGATGMGKSTTLAALINIINNLYRKHIITLEDPIEYVFESNRSIIHQRGLGYDILSFEDGIRESVREDVDVLVVGEMRDYETIRLALSAAETGVLVFATLHTTSAAKTIDRVIDVFPAEEQAEARAMLSQSLRAVTSQLLFRRIDDLGRIPTTEVLFGSVALTRIIRDGKVHEIPSLIQTGKSAGMISMDDSIEELLKKKMVNAEEVYPFTQDKSRFEYYLKYT
ncbi:TPA: type IV pili twitching motility protein PilT [bacterium]|nr:type IV pili twitching motility protein PilT [bacterium]